MDHLCTAQPRAPGLVQGVGRESISLLGLAYLNRKIEKSYCSLLKLSENQPKEYHMPTYHKWNRPVAYFCAAVLPRTRPRRGPMPRKSLTHLGCTLARSSTVVHLHLMVVHYSRLNKTLRTPALRTLAPYSLPLFSLASTPLCHN
jgi:hypothetical protein